MMYIVLYSKYLKLKEHSVPDLLKVYKSKCDCSHKNYRYMSLFLKQVDASPLTGHTSSYIFQMGKIPHLTLFECLP